MLEVYLILDHFDTYRQHNVCCTRLNGGLSDNSMDPGLTQEELEYIAQVIEMDDVHRFSKKALLPLKRIKEKMTGKADKECFCSMVRRKIWYKDFINWYESIA
jgi:hypothetical protein